MDREVKGVGIGEEEEEATLNSVMGAKKKAACKGEHYTRRTRLHMERRQGMAVHNGDDDHRYRYKRGVQTVDSIRWRERGRDVKCRDQKEEGIDTLQERMYSDGLFNNGHWEFMMDTANIESLTE